MMTIRQATVADLEAINAIYNHYVLTSTATYQTVPSTEAERAAWFKGHGAKHPVLVMEAAGEVVGWGSLSAYHPREAFARTVENSIYIHHGHQRKGYGGAMLSELTARAKALGHHVVVAVIDSVQAGSIALHAKAGFKEVGRLTEVGWKFEKWLHVVYMQRVV